MHTARMHKIHELTLCTVSYALVLSEEIVEVSTLSQVGKLYAAFLVRVEVKSAENGNIFLLHIKICTEVGKNRVKIVTTFQRYRIISDLSEYHWPVFTHTSPML